MANEASIERRGGRLAHRLSPEGERELEALSDRDRVDLAQAWLERAALEQRAADAFALVLAALQELAVAGGLSAFAESARVDELRHAELSRVVASRFAGRDLAAPSSLPASLPEFRDIAPRLGAALTLIGHTVIAETFASSVLECSLRRASGRLARAALIEMLSDELDHAPIGWTYLAGASAAQRSELAPFLHGLVAAELQRSRAFACVHSNPALELHGVPTRESAERALFGAVRQTILPGFLSFGLPADEIWIWLRRGASTRPEALRNVANFPEGACPTRCEESFDLR